MSDLRVPDRLVTRLGSDEAGIGLIELLIALTLVAVGIAAALSVFASSIVSLQHGAKEGTALTLADRQLEAYRAMSFACLPTTLTSGLTLPSQLSPSVDAACGAPFEGPPYGTYTDPRDPSNATPFPNPYAASQTVPGNVSPDHRAYTVVTSVTANSPQCGGTSTQIIVSVNLVGDLTNLARESSCFSRAGSPAAN